MDFNPFSALTSKIFGGVAIAAIAAFALQTCRADRLEAQRDDARELARAEKKAHAGTVANYRAAAIEVARVQAANLARVAAEQERISDETIASYDARLADARRRLREAGAATDPGRAGEAAVSGTGDAAGRAAQATDHLLSPSERLIAAEQAIQLDELISWALRQAAVSTSPAPPAASTD